MTPKGISSARSTGDFGCHHSSQEEHHHFLGFCSLCRPQESRAIFLVKQPWTFLLIPVSTAHVWTCKSGTKHPCREPWTLESPRRGAPFPQCDHFSHPHPCQGQHPAPYEPLAQSSANGGCHLWRSCAFLPLSPTAHRELWALRPAYKPHVLPGMGFDHEKAVKRHSKYQVICQRERWSRTHTGKFTEGRPFSHSLIHSLPSVMSLDK